MISQTILIRFHILPNLMVMRSSNENLNKGQEFADWEISIFCSTSEILMNILYFQYYKYILSVVIYFMSLDCESSRLMSSSRITTSKFFSTFNYFSNKQELQLAFALIDARLTNILFSKHTSFSGLSKGQEMQVPSSQECYNYLKL